MRATQLFSPREWQLALPLAIFLHLFYVAPLAVLLATSVQSAPGVPGFSLAQYWNFFQDAINVDVLLDTFWLGVQVTLGCLLFGYPVAYLYANAPAKWKGILTFLILLPLLTSAVVRTFGWVVILGKQGLINSLLLSVGFAEPIKLLFTHHGVAISMTQIQLPLMILPIVASLAQIDPRLAAASESLGGGAWRTFWQITFPLTLPGIISGCLLVFALTVSSFVTPSIIGGGQIMYMPTLIYQQAVVLLNGPFAAAISAILLAMVLMVVFGLSALGQKTRAYIR